MRVAVDTSVVVNFLTGGLSRDDPMWFSHSSWVFEAAANGEHLIVIPALVIAEVAGCGEIRGTHIEARLRRQRIGKVRDWIDQSQFVPAEITLDVANRAAELAINHQLTGADACILAVAAEYDCEVLYTWDDGLLKVGDEISGLVVVKPERALPLQHEFDFE